MQTTRKDHGVPYEIPRGRDLTGRLARFGRDWRMKDLPDFYRIDRTSGNDLVETPSSAIQNGDFVLTEARLDLVTFINEETRERESTVQYAMEKVVRLFTERDLQVRVPRSSPAE